jgi:uncharacterized protein
MLNFKPLTLQDKDIFDNYLKPYTFSTCEYSFTNLYIWRKGCEIEYAVYKNAILIKRIDLDNSYNFLQPIGYKKEDLKEIIDVLIEYSIENHFKFLFRNIEKPFMEELKALFEERFIIEEDRDNFDYIYESQKLISLSGKNYHNKKNHYNAFIKNYDFYIAPLSLENLEECITASKEWCNKNDCKGYLLYELRAIQDILKNKDKLDFIGMVVYVDNKIAAFTLGEIMNDDMAIVHIEKADSDIRGLYAYVNKTFVENYLSSVPFINREQDLGVEGLRKAKESYLPIRLEPKYAAKVK